MKLFGLLLNFNINALCSFVLYFVCVGMVFLYLFG